MTPGVVATLPRTGKMWLYHENVRRVLFPVHSASNAGISHHSNGIRSSPDYTPVFKIPKNLYQLMELGHLGSLTSIIKQQEPPDTSICQFYFANLVSAIEFLHGQGWIHCDVKPDNLVIETRNRNMRLGTVAYSCPEVLQDCMEPQYLEEMDPGWGAGCVLYEMATGKAAFRTLKYPVPKDTGGRESELEERVMGATFYWQRGLEIDSQIKDLVNGMRFAGTDGQRTSAGRYQNVKLRTHPFIKTFPWEELNERKLVAPFASEGIPDVSSCTRKCSHAEPLHYC
ncbi:kinase-like domain-containing protein [Irpex rosettiformis]|uniref:Kinase-like domain-containing protein n=1 Tax=Irpex rosettiformis TaxID=378272 RepID=A0ACB8UI76_9APHY|nr:kinase-like domain-containing protein [Irpex rosettiformis]